MKARYCIILFVISALSDVSFSINADQLKKSVESSLEILELLKRLPARNLVEELKETSEIVQRTRLSIQGFIFYLTAGDDVYKNITGKDPQDRVVKWKQMLETLKSMKDRLNVLDAPIAGKSIDWSRIEIRLPAVRSSLLSLSYSLNMAFTAPRAANPIFIRIFKNAYESNEPATKQLMTLFMQKSNPITKNLFDKAREYFKNDPTVMQHFAGFYVRLFIRSLIIDTSYYTFTGETSRMDKSHEEWKKSYESLKARAATIDRDIKESWTFQYVPDVDELGEAVVAKTSNNKMIAQSIYTFLSKKFPQRKWFVLVHDYTGDSAKDRYYDNCRDYINRFGEKKVVVNSVDAKQNQPKIKLYTIFANIDSHHGPYAPKTWLAQVLYQKCVKMNCEQRKFVGAIESKADPRYYAAANHAFQRTVMMSRHFHINSKPYHLIVFA